jgi:protein-disulfide isomerase
MTSGNVLLPILLALCIRCTAQLAPPELALRIEQKVRVSQKIPADVRLLVSSLRASDFAGYRALTVTLDDNGRREDVDFLLSEDGKTLAHLTRFDLTRDPYADTMSRITLQGRPVRGNPQSGIKAILYDDFECPFCARVHQVLFPELLKEYGDQVAFIYKDFPLSEIHPWAMHAAVNANCLAAQNSEAYWDFADYVHANQRIVNADTDLNKEFVALDRIALREAEKFGLDTSKLQGCLNAQDDTAIKKSVKEGESVGVDGTPTVFVNGQKLDGAASAREFRAAFDRAIQDAASAAKDGSASQR